jgi:hypothetical protein
LGVGKIDYTVPVISQNAIIKKMIINFNEKLDRLEEYQRQKLALVAIVNQIAPEYLLELT